jgi:arylsulfatase A-like enzyme/Flp pilus assembly protein TadD
MRSRASARAGRRPGRAGVALLLLFVGAVGCRNRGTTRRPFAGVERPDVVLVTIDTLRFDALGSNGNGRVETPVLDRLAREGRTFVNAHAQNVVTLPSHANILTGLYPFEHGVRNNDSFRLPDGIPTLATILKAKGYATAAFIGAFPLDSRFGLARGFDVYDQSYPQGANEYQFVLPERPAAEVVPAARAWLARARTAGAPRFLWVHLYDCHAPYRPPEPFASRYAAEPYLGEVAAVDAALAPLVEDLARAESKTPALLVVTSDHGEALGDHGEKTHGLFAYEATLHVPLILWAPGWIPAAADSRSARHVDILPTVLSLVRGASVPKAAAGAGLLDLPPTSSRGATEASYFESLTTFYERGWAPLRGVVSRGFKYVDLPVPELYDLGADPAEKSNLALRRTDVVRELKARLPKAAFSTGPATAAEKTSVDTAANLRSLGYLAGRGAAKERFGPEDDPKTLVGIDAQIHEMVDLYQTRHGAEAVALAQRILRERPEMSTGYEYLSFLQGQAGNDSGAIRTLQEAQRRGLLDDRLRSRLGLLLAGVGKPEEALRVLAPLFRSVDPDAWNAIGIARSGAGQTASAVEAFERALSLDPRNAIACQNIGIAFVQAGDFRRALAAFDRAFALNERLPRAWNGRGVALEELGRHAEAVAAWKRAVDLDPAQFDALFNIGVVSAEHADAATARTALQAFLEHVPPSRSPADVMRAKQILARLP